MIHFQNFITTKIRREEESENVDLKMAQIYLTLELLFHHHLCRRLHKFDL